MITIIEPGVQTTVQDLGRPGLGAMGVVRGGAADPVSLVAGNRMVGNEDGAAALEVTLSAFEMELGCEARVAITGAETDAPMWRAMTVGAGERLRISMPRRGARVYVCVRGGIDVRRVLGSASTHLGAGFGGHEGRALRRGDRLAIGGESGGVEASGEWVEEARSSIERRVIRAIAAPRRESFGEEFWRREFRVSPQSDRVGLRLRGERIESASRGTMVSEGVAWGSVQVPEDGEPIVLGVDHPTTGGYPVIACVAAVDLPVIGQLRPGDEVRFERVSVERARELWGVRAERMRRESRS